MDNDILKKLAYTYKDEIIPPFDKLLDLVGYEGLCLITDQCGGSNLYIPHKKALFWGCVTKQVEIEFNGVNYRELCRKYEVCSRTVRNIMERSTGMKK